ncbi:stage II sporulation protein D [Oceanobacillus oncorhynchi subsp. incaldanensis]|uniref:Amidase enhancer n=1 Tax=Oceanobacillus oncorhynchi TaxID=545501 RepID=A0A0A1MCP4_9BACI|nr:stage II sporulation protein D [Oceanobacillus oncorhynchi]MDM8102817.1 stage II sporulation protein D [Oceanobacillus oncorhynchi]UUI39593.1 stage II sporulation protein D [Oceanobacillus oncorhynchi]GIO20125.1 stage II sporulation protein D [Oceanobacillus oncorhynchi subsp. incaldanensis]CEI80793.1 Amidase enhancer precursor [Oceanobacillus oncorhynchi]
MYNKKYKRKNTAIHKKMKQLKQKNRISNQPMQKIVPFSNRKSVHYKPQRPSPWKQIVITVFMVMIIFILAVPTVVVQMSKTENQISVGSETVDNKEEAKPDEEDEPENPPEETATSDEAVEVGASPFNVSVMRVSNEEVENVPVEQYVAGVVSSEMPAEFELEALKAQAIAARTFTVNFLLNGEKNDSYDLTDSTQHQVYKSEQELQEQWGAEYHEKMNKINQAVKETEGQIITYNSAPITASFFSTSNGYTENSEDYWEGEVAYLRSVESPWDEASPEFTQQTTLTVAEVSEALEIPLQDDKAIPMEISHTDSGRVDEITVAGNAFTGPDFRDKLGLRSSDFTIEQSDSHLIFTTQGYGHGVGMSQYGANGMAAEGKNYEEIIHHYYTDVEISQIGEIAPTLVSN